MDAASATLSGSCDEHLLTTASPCAMQSLPVEILRRILGMSVVREEYARLEDLTTVCQQWRDVILDDGMLWNAVYVAPYTTIGQMSTLLRRSAHCNLSLNIGSGLGLFFELDSLTCVELALGQYQRVVQLAIDLDERDCSDGPDAWPSQITRRLASASIWPELQDLSLAQWPLGRDHDVFIELHVSAPQLHTLSLAVNVQDWSTLGAALPNLQNLSVKYITSAASLLPVLSNISGLRDLRFYTRKETLSADLPPSFSLPHLHWLEIEAMVLRSDVLSALVSSNSPKLTTLSVVVREIEMLENWIELSSLQLKDLRIEHLDGTIDGFALPVCFRVVPRALNTLRLTGVTGDIAALITPSLLKLELACTDVDVENLSFALSQCQRLDRLVFTSLRSTSAVVSYPPVTQSTTAVLPRLVYAELGTIWPNDPRDIGVRRLFLDLLPPTVRILKITGTPCPSGDDLRSVLEDILISPTHLSLSFTSFTRGGAFTLTDTEEGASERMFNVAVDSRAGSEYLAILLSQPAFHAHIRLLAVGLAPAFQILEQCADGMPLLEELQITLPSDLNCPYNADKAQNALQIVQSVPSPISCPRLAAFYFYVDGTCCSDRVLIPIALKHAVVGLFQSQADDVCITSHPAVEWVE